MRYLTQLLFFDRYDHQLLRIVNDVLARGKQSQSMHSLLGSYLHPQGIKEMAAPRGLRIAYAITSLLGSLDKGHASDRITALRSLRDEVLVTSTTYFKKNTARVLLQLMKDLLRSGGDKMRQLKLAHDFRMVSAGNPRRVREELAKYHLIEMPEEWNQYAFDDHVHDANTKGRKSPTHLVMDAWIKGIRHLTVVYYNYVAPEVVQELLEASSILDIRVQVGIEFVAEFRGKYARFLWSPQGFIDNHAFLKFFRDEGTISLMNLGRKVSEYQQKYVFDALDAFNSRHRLVINEEFRLALEPLSAEDFTTFVGAGQPSVLHLARFIQNGLHSAEQKTGDASPDESPAEGAGIADKLSIEKIVDTYLAPSCNPEVYNPNIPQDIEDLPKLLLLSPRKLLKKLLSLHSASTITLDLSNLTIQDTMELLYNCEGMISHIESYNLKDASHGMYSDAMRQGEGADGDAVDIRSPEKYYRLIGQLQRALSEDNVINLKSVIRTIIWDFEEQIQKLNRYIYRLPPEKAERFKVKNDYQAMLERKQALLEILSHLEEFFNFYKNRKIGSKIGSDSTGGGSSQHGMGFVVLDTLPGRSKRYVKAELGGGKRTAIPIFARLTHHTYKKYSADESVAGRGLLANWQNAMGDEPRQREDWSVDGFVVHPENGGNMVSLGGIAHGNGFSQASQEPLTKQKSVHSWQYLNTNLKNSLKVFFGFIPAFLTFYLTKDWWLLAYFGAIIWFGITGSRNIIQSVLGGGGLRRSPLLPWNSLVSWSRIADSLLYTGFSVPLLDYLVKTLLLDQYLGVTTATNPVLLYAVMGLANGIYISGHNIFRGLPKAAAAGNFFRSILAIPLAIGLNALIGAILGGLGVAEVSSILQKWAAIISKFASDCVAAVIEGLADRHTNIQARLKGYQTKIGQMYKVYAQLEICFPDRDVLDLLESPKEILRAPDKTAKEAEILIIVNSLDLMYFWLYQPRARRALGIMVENMTWEEWLIFYRSQIVLTRYKEISQLFVDGLVGRNFSKALAFYLDRSEQYLSELGRLNKAGPKISPAGDES
jgi:hypothetical protein